ncbi:MAG: alpha/beta fold hydrolase, partial [Actinomycetota bacterium]
VSRYLCYAVQRLVVGAALTAGAGAALGLGLRGLGRRVQNSSDSELDPLLAPATGVSHHHLTTDDGATIHVAEAGAGPPVVLLHGVTLQWSIWNPLFHLLAPQHRVVAWDMRGHGASTHGSRDLTLGAVADDLALILGRLDIHDAVIVGHSMGGMALARFCTDHHRMLHHRCRGLVFLATSAAPVALSTVTGGGAGLIELVNRAVTAGMESPRWSYRWSDNATSALLVRLSFGRHASGAAIEQVRAMLAEVDPRTTASAGRAIALHDVRDDLGHVDVPALVVVGSADLLTPPAHAKGVAAAIPGAQLHVLDGVGHQVMQEAPTRLATLITSVGT